MGKVFGILALVFGLLGLLGGWLLVIWLPFGNYYLPAAAIVFGIIGIIVDDSKGMAIAGLILGVIGLIVGFIIVMFLLAFIMGLLGMALI